MAGERYTPEKICSQIAGIADAFYRLEIKNGLQQLSDMSDEIWQVYKANGDCEKLREINETLNLVLSCVQNRDYILVADLLKHELAAQMASLAHKN